MGSAAAPVGIKDRYYDMGFESKNVPNDDAKSNFVTFSIAEDFFIILFNLPSGLEGVGTSQTDSHSIALPGLPAKKGAANKLGSIMKGVYGSNKET